MTSIVHVKVSETGLSAQDIISLPKALVKYGLIRRKNPTITFGKWPHRFIVLLRDSVYVYHDEKSRSPTLTFSLLGYNRVKRVTSKKHDWCFAVLPDTTHASLKPEKFACVSDAERKEWMVAIKTQMYPANNMETVPYRPLSFTEEDEYLKIEEPIYDPRNREQDTISTTSEDESSSDSEIEENIPVIPVYGRSKRSYSVPQVLTQEEVDKLRQLSRTKGSKKADDEDECFKKKESRENGSRTLSRVSSVPPPRYSEVIQEVESETEEETKRITDYANLRGLKMEGSFGEPIPAPELYDVPPEKAELPPELCPGVDSKPDPPLYLTPANDIIPPLPKRHNKRPNPIEVELFRRCSVSPTEEVLDEEDNLYVSPSDELVSLEDLCSVDDLGLDRDYIICRLRDKQLTGTYLLRRSRQGEGKVLAYLDAGGEVREYKIYTQGDQVYMKKELMFSTMDDLLRHYTYNSPLPCSNNDHLKFGFNAVQ